MPRPELIERVNLDVPENKDKVRRFFAIVSGVYEIKATPASDKHGDQQRKYYFGHCIKALMDYLNQFNACRYTKDQCHEILAKDCLPLIDVIDPVTGEVIDTVRTSITTLNKSQMGDFIDRVRHHLGDWNIPTDPPDPNWRDNTAERRTASTTA